MLRRAWHCLGSRHRVQLIVTPDIVTQPNAGGCADVLICPANEGLSGTRLLPYFERGGAPVLAPPAPPPGGVMWGGMEAGDRMLYAGQVIDGQVHALGGAALREACEALPPRDSDGRRCAIGEAALTCAPGELGRHFRHIVHTATPAFRGDCHAGEQAAVGAWATALGSCYESSLELAARCCGRVRARCLARRWGRTSLSISMRNSGRKLCGRCACSDVPGWHAHLRTRRSGCATAWPATGQTMTMMVAAAPQARGAGAGTGTAPRTTPQRSTTRAMRAGGCPTASRSVGNASSPSTHGSGGIDYSTAELPQVEAEM